MEELVEVLKPNITSALAPTKNNESDSSGTSKMNNVEMLFKKIIFVVIAVVAILGNSLFCAVLVRKRASLRRPYNKLLLSLSVTDLLTGKLLLGTCELLKDKWAHHQEKSFFAQHFTKKQKRVLQS